MIENNVLVDGKDLIDKNGVAIIPEGVTEIGSYSFYNCSALKEVTLPESVTKIGYSAFEECTSLEEIIIPNNLTKIGVNAFNDCKSLEKIKIPDSVTEIGLCAFWGCSSLKEVTIPNSVTEISMYTFQECKSLEKIAIPDSVTEIGISAFEGCKSLEEIDIPNSVSKIGGGSFSNCLSLKEILIPDNVTEIGMYTFENCQSLRRITIPDSVTEIERCAFRSCVSLEKITIPKSVTEIGMYAFHDCTSLKDITISNNEIKVGKCAFKFTGYEKAKREKEVVEVPEGVTKLNDHILTSEVKELIIPSSLREFGIQDISNLEKISLPYNYLEGKNINCFIDILKTNPKLKISASPQDILLLREKVDATFEPTISFLEYYKDPSTKIQGDILIDQQIDGYHIKKYDIGDGQTLYEIEKNDIISRNENLFEAMKDVEYVCEKEHGNEYENQCDDLER